MNEIKSLTSLRGLVALWVLSYHLYVLSPVPITDRFGLMQRGYLGVDFFFVLSGFVLAGAYGRKFANSFDPTRYRWFVIVRAGRMFPLHIVVTAVCVFFAWYFSTPFSPVQVGEETLLIHRWPFVPAMFNAINGPAWSISAEWFANLLFPAIVAVTLGPKRAWLPITVLVVSAASLAALASTKHGSLDQSLANTLAPSIRCVAEFSIGMLLYRWQAIASGGDWLILVICAIGGIGLVGMLGDVVLVAVMAVLISALSVNIGVAGKILTMRPLYWLGRVSFSIYLIHLPIINVVRFCLKQVGPAPGMIEVLFIVGSLGITLVVSGLTYSQVESRARNWSKKLASRQLRLVNTRL
jgi:peptidoglycan/LPS O-acetylase OafA/YrhL